MGVALGIGTPTFNPTQAGLFANPWIGGGAVGVQTPQLVHALQHLLQVTYAGQQQLQQLAQLVPQQLQLIQYLIQIVAHQQPYPFALQPPLQSFAPLGASVAQSPIFGGQPGYVM
jgi:hypothetical protein